MKTIESLKSKVKFCIARVRRCVASSSKKYFISFSHSGKYGSGFGSIGATLSIGIRNWDDLEEIKEKIIEKYNVENVVILSWRRFV